MTSSRPGRLRTLVLCFLAFRGAALLAQQTPPAPPAPQKIALWPDQAPVGDGAYEKGDSFITVYLPGQGPDVVPANMFQVVNRCFQILQTHAEDSWRKHSDLVITPAVRSVQWDGFGNGPDLIEAGAAAALDALPKIQAWLDAQPRGQIAAAPVMPSSKPA